jgi:hypothetical protein
LFHFTLNLGNHDSVVHMVRLLCRKVGAFTCPQHDPQENTSPEETLTYLHAPNVIRTHDPTFCMIEGSTHRRCRCLSLALLRSYRQWLKNLLVICRVLPFVKDIWTLPVVTLLKIRNACSVIPSQWNSEELTWVKERARRSE